MDNRNIDHVCTFTGHRPERLALPEAEVIRWLTEQIVQAVNDGYTDFITGMQRGVDIWAAEVVLKLRKECKPLRLIAACAFRGMENQWEMGWQERYRTILTAADEVHYIGARPGRQAFFARNHWMADRASRLIAVYTGAPGGTKETIDYAKTKHLRIVMLSAQNEAK